MDLSGRHVVVTGASQGIGERLAERFAARGAHVLGVARSADRLAGLAERIGGRWLAADLTDPVQVDALVARCLAELGHVDVWVNNAGVETEDAFVHVDRAALRTLLRLNVEATVLLTRDIVAHFVARDAGHLVQLSSVAGAVAFPGLAAYGASKAAVTSLTETLRLELAGTHVGFTVVAPGPVDTGMWDRIDTGRSWPGPALDRFHALHYLPKVDPGDLADQVVRAVEQGRPHVRPKARFQVYHVLNNLPRRLVGLSLSGVRLPPVVPDDPAAPAAAWHPVWPTDNPPSRVWPLYTRGNIGEVFPDVVAPLTWRLYGQAAEDGWRAAFRALGLLQPGDLPVDEDKVILGVFGGYGYINASYVRLLGVRAPGGTVEAIDTTFFGESDAPPYRPRPGDKHLGATVRLGRTVLRLLGTSDLPALREDKDVVAAYVARYPGDDASDDALLAHLHDSVPLFERLFGRHIENTFSVALVSGALVELCASCGSSDQLVALLGGIGDVESAAPSSAMWALARAAATEPAVAAAFDAGVPGLDRRLRDDPGCAVWVSAFDDFLAHFGSRGPNEWDLASDPWEFRPELALAAIDRMRGADATHDPARQAERLAAGRADAVRTVRALLDPVKRFQFDKALAATTRYSQARERSKTTVIVAIHAARRAQRELARRIAERGGPAERRHTCLLTPEEFAGALRDPAPYLDEIARRVELHARLTGLVPPFVFEGTPPPIDTWESRDAAVSTVAPGERLQGIAGCPGVARGRARVVLSPDDPRDLGPGDVLVAPITDPSWTPLFLAAEAVVVDVGATMSHAVIVSRELGIPCVVSAVGATRRIPDGALLEVDGSTGTVTVLALPGG